MRWHAFRGLALALTVFVAAACMHATIDTGVKPSDVVIEKPWALAWVYGLVPPNTLETISQCPKGVAKVETQISFLNGLVGLLTLEILTPMEIKVTCAATGLAAASHVSDMSVAEATKLSAEEHAPVYIRIQ